MLDAFRRGSPDAGIAELRWCLHALTVEHYLIRHSRVELVSACIDSRTLPDQAKQNQDFACMH